MLCVPFILQAEQNRKIKGVNIDTVPTLIGITGVV